MKSGSSRRSAYKNLIATYWRVWISKAFQTSARPPWLRGSCNSYLPVYSELVLIQSHAFPTGFPGAEAIPYARHPYLQRSLSPFCACENSHVSHYGHQLRSDVLTDAMPGHSGETYL